MSLKNKGPVVLVVLDGVGESEVRDGNALLAAELPNLRKLWDEGATISIEASGEYVGKTAGEPGDSEVGHLTMGSGKVVAQDVVRVGEFIDSGELFKNKEWTDTVAWVKERSSTLHFSGITSDGAIHSDIRHLYKMLDMAAKQGVQRVRVHLLLDGRDRPPQSALEYVDELEKRLERFRMQGLDYWVADGIGREMGIADRYYADLPRLERGYQLWVNGAGREFETAREAIEAMRAEQPDIQDQFLQAFVIKEKGRPVGLVQDGDAIIYYDFRADRAIEIAEVFDSPKGWYDRFELGQRPDVRFVGMTEYDGDREIPQHYFVKKPSYNPVLMEVLQEAGVNSFAISESFKYGHITFYFDGLKKEPFYGETTVEIKSGLNLLKSRPWMGCAEITDALLGALPNYDFLRVNYANGDMVGHIAEMESSRVAMEAIDIQMGRLMEEVSKIGGVLVVTADHGKIEEITYEDGTPKTAHTNNPVLFTVWGTKVKLKDGKFGLANVAATVADLLGVKPDKTWDESLIAPRD